MSAREAVLARIRAAVADAPAVPAVPREYRTRGESSREAVVDLFVERVRDYRAAVVVTDDPRAAVAAALTEHGAARVGVATDLEPALRPADVELVEDAALDPSDLDALDGAVTTCAAGCAETGTIALDGGAGQGRRALSLVPDLHVCVIRADQVVSDVPEAVQRLQASIDARQPLTWISGPSATSDIELNRVEGVHGPRTLHVLLVR